MKIKVELAKRSYYIWIGKGILSSVGRVVSSMKLAQAAYIITSQGICSLYGKKLEKSLLSSGLLIKFYTVPASEKTKSYPVWAKVLKDIADFDRGRGVVVIALGGGVVGDLSGFVASCYRRGIPFVQVPTTLLAQVDSAIGGKVAIDIESAKNLVGAFYQPKAVFSDISALNTLPKREIKNGLAEVIKYGVILDREIISYLEKNTSKILKLNTSSMEYLISRCSRLKAEVVSADEKEKLGYRSILNFGHTIGHAIEAASSYRKSVSHGEAVSIGMLCAFDIALSLGMVRQEVAERIEALIKRIGLPTHIKGVKTHRVLKATSYDKKILMGKQRWVLPCDIGHAVVCSSVPRDVIKKAVIKRIG